MSNLEVIPRELPTLLCTSIVQSMQMCSGGQDINHAIPWMDFKHTEARQDGRHFADDIFKCIFLNENIWITIKISLKFVPKGPINNIPTLVQIMSWRQPGDKPIWTNDGWLNYRRIYAALGFNELTNSCKTPKFLFKKVNLNMKLLSVQNGSHFVQQNGCHFEKTTVWNAFL